MEPLFVWIGILLCLSQSAMLSGLNLACFSISRLQLEIETSENNQDAIKVLELRKDSSFLLTTESCIRRSIFIPAGTRTR